MTTSEKIILESARNLIKEAYNLGIVITIDSVPQQPLAMGNFEMVPSVRVARIKEVKEIEYVYDYESEVTHCTRFGLYPGHRFLRGSPKGMLKVTEEYSTKIAEYIEYAACFNLRNDEIFVVNQPGRHHHVVHFMASIGIKQTTLANQGFLTNRGRYVNRTEAMIIARKADQLLDKNKDKSYRDRELYSEDVW